LDNLKKAWEIFVKKGVINKELIDEKIGYSWAKSKLMGLNPFTSFDTIIMSDMDIAKKKSDYESYIDIISLLIGNVDYLKENYDVYLVDTNDDVIFEELNSARSSNFFKLGMKIDEKSIGTTAYNIYRVNKVISILRGAEHFYSIMHNLTSIAFEVNENLAVFAVGPFMDMDQDRIKKLIDLKNKIQNYKNESSFEDNNNDIIEAVFGRINKEILIFDNRFNLLKAYGYSSNFKKFDEYFTEKSLDKIRIMMFNKDKNSSGDILINKNGQYFEIVEMDNIDDKYIILTKKLEILEIDYSKVELFYNEISTDKVNILVNFNDQVRDSIVSSFLSKFGEERIILCNISNSEGIPSYTKALSIEEMYISNLYFSNDPFEVYKIKNDIDNDKINIIDGFDLIRRYNIDSLGLKLVKRDTFESIKGENIVVNTFTNVDKIEDAEKIMIEKVILKNNYNFTKASVELGIGRSTLYRKMKKYGIDMKK
jgi:DNA-binding protein Fis